MPDRIHPAALDDRIVDLLATLSDGADAAMLQRRLRLNAGVDAETGQIEARLEALFDARRIAGYGSVFCLPAQVAHVRDRWLMQASIAIRLRSADQSVKAAEDAAIGRLRAWTGWNMPIRRSALAA